MTHIEQKIEVDAGAGAVWQVVGDFNRLDVWHKYVKPYPTTGSGPGAVRTLTLGGNVIDETLANVDAANRTCIITIGDDSPMPYENYSQTLRVNDLGDGRSEVVWTADFAPRGLPEDKVVEMLGGFIAAGLKGIQKHFAE